MIRPAYIKVAYRISVSDKGKKYELFLKNMITLSDMKKRMNYEEFARIHQEVKYNTKEKV